MQVTIDKDAFSRNLGTKCRIRHKDSPVVIEAELAELTDKSTDTYEQFSVLFSGPPEPVLSQRIFQIEHDTMGTFDLFLVPIAADEKGATYEAVINKARK